MRIHYSLYYELYKNGDYEGALPALGWMLENAPAFPHNSDRNFDRAAKAYSAVAIEQESEALREAYLDSAMTIFQTAVPRLAAVGIEADEFDWTLKQGRFIHENVSLFPDRSADIAKMYRMAFELDAQRLDPYYLKYIVIDLVQNQDDKTAALAFLDAIEAARPEEAEVDVLLVELRNQLIKNPEERYDFLNDQLDSDPQNLELLREIFELALQEEWRDVAYKTGSQLVGLEPSFTVLRQLAEMNLADGLNETAVQLLTRAIKLAESDADKRDLQFNMGIAEQQLGRLSVARTRFKKALDLDPGFGRAHLAIGDLYVTAVSNCSTFDRRDRAVYWLVVDKYERAKKADGSLAGQADARIKSYQSYFPSEEDKFFLKWNTGDAYKVTGGCYGWIGETTTVR